jgi:acyl-CoA reductase-like NAD-dependent aldehyde dehydrogenase
MLCDTYMSFVECHPHIGGAPQVDSSRSYQDVRSPYDGTLVGRVALAGASDLEQAIAGASAAFESLRRSPTYERALLLERIALGIDAAREEFARSIALESGKPLRYARAEVARAATTFRLAAAETRSFDGSVLPSDQLPGAEGRLTLFKRVPRGPIGGISPFNFPLNLAAHKLAPALAVGAPLVLKAPPRAPLTAHRLAQLASEAGAPPHAFNVLHLMPEVAEQLATDRRLPVLSFTGSDSVGWHLARVAERKQVLLELGGNAPCLVDETCDFEVLLPRLVEGCFANAGQVCIKAQRVYVVQQRFPEFLERFVALTAELAVGDPLDERTVVGPLIEQRQLERVQQWLSEARAGGARLVCGGAAEGHVLAPTVLSDTRANMRVCKDEIFGPVTVVEPVPDFEEGLRACNASRFGIQASVFTREIGRALRAFDMLSFPGVLINDAPTFRVDNVPYGGTRDSGRGREGVRFAMEEYTETRLLSLRGSE